MISDFSGDYAYLSNLYPCSVMYWGELYPSVENAYYAAMTEDKKARVRFQKMISFEVAHHAESIIVRDDWPGIKLRVMSELVADKFIIHQRLCMQLILTRPEKLIYENRRGDTFWGTRNGIGENNLGKILMQCRSRLLAIRSNRELCGIQEVRGMTRRERRRKRSKELSPV